MNTNPLSDLPALSCLVVDTNWIANPSEAPMLVILSVQPTGAVTVSGRVSRKSSSGSQAYQNVPIWLAVVARPWLVFFNVIEYWYVVGVNFEATMVALAVCLA